MLFKFSKQQNYMDILTTLYDDVSKSLISFYIISDYQIFMKEQSSNQSITDHQESSQQRKDQIEKKRKIRKQKTHTNVIDFSDLKNIDTKKLTREERAKVQKVKNRQAAQRSRDMHKEYVARLEQQVRELRETMNDSRNLCWRCKKQLEDSTSHDSNHSDRQIDERQKIIPVQGFQFECESFRDPLQLPVINNPSGIFEDDSFMRIQENSNDYSLFKIGFFVFAVVAVLTVGVAYSPEQSSRALMTLPQTDGNQIQGLSIDTLKKMEELLKSQSKDQDLRKTAVVRVESASISQHGLIALNNNDCLKSLMKVEQPQPQLNTNSLTSYNDNHYTKNYLSHQQGILLCSLRMPKPYPVPSTESRTPLVRLYLLGSQIKDLITNFNLMIPLRDNDNIETNGIYEVLARIKEVNKVTNHNCLL